MLFALSLVLFALSVAAYFGVPRWQARQQTRQAERTVADLQRFAAAFQRYAHDHGDWPESSAAPSHVPPGMQDLLKDTGWDRPAPIGGRYVWLTDTPQLGQRVHAAIAVVSLTDAAVTGDKRQLAELLRIGTASGPVSRPLRLGFRNEPIYILEQ